MSVIPLHPQRRFEQRWAAQFGSRVFSAVPKTVRLKGSPVNIAPRVAKAKEKENLPVEMADRIITSNWSRYAINPRHVVVAYGI